MQISFLKHLKFPETPPQIVPGRDKDAAAPDATSGMGAEGGAGSAATRRADHKASGDIREQREKPDVSGAGGNAASPGVIVTISGNRNNGAASGVQGELVYTNKPAAGSSISTPEQDPLADNFVGTKSEEFVHYAVTTIRQFAEEQERARANARPDGGQDNQGVHLIPRNLGDIQKLASRFKLFA